MLPRLITPSSHRPAQVTNYHNINKFWLGASKRVVAKIEYCSETFLFYTILLAFKPLESTSNYLNH